jgi:hypothetical protein
VQSALLLFLKAITSVAAPAGYRLPLQGLWTGQPGRTPGVEQMGFYCFYCDTWPGKIISLMNYVDELSLLKKDVLHSLTIQIEM